MRERPWRCDEDAALMRLMEEASARRQTGHAATVMASANFVAAKTLAGLPVLRGRSARDVKILRALRKYERYFVRFEKEAVMRKKFEEEHAMTTEEKNKIESGKVA